jgi:hypothetical protein
VSAAEGIHRAWIIVGWGSVFLALAALQFWWGKAFVGFALPWHPSPWAKRRKEPILFWFHVGLLAALGIFCVGMGLPRIL